MPSQGLWGARVLRRKGSEVQGFWGARVPGKARISTRIYAGVRGAVALGEGSNMGRDVDMFELARIPMRQFMPSLPYIEHPSLPHIELAHIPMRHGQVRRSWREFGVCQSGGHSG